MMAVKPKGIAKKSLFRKIAFFFKKRDTTKPIKTSTSGDKDSNDTESICNTCIDSYCTSCCDISLENFNEKERIAPIRHTPHSTNPHDHYLRSTVNEDNTDNRSQITLAAANTDGAIGGKNTPKDTSPSAPTLQSISKAPVETPKTTRSAALFNSLAKSPLFTQRLAQSKTKIEQNTGARPKTTLQDNNDWSINQHGDSCLCESCYKPVSMNTQNITVGDLTSVLSDLQKSQALTLLQGLAPFSGNSIFTECDQQLGARMRDQSSVGLDIELREPVQFDPLFSCNDSSSGLHVATSSITEYGVALGSSQREREKMKMFLSQNSKLADKIIFLEHLIAKLDGLKGVETKQNQKSRQQNFRSDTFSQYQEPNYYYYSQLTLLHGPQLNSTLTYRHPQLVKEQFSKKFNVKTPPLKHDREVAQSQKNIVCYRCNKQGHYARNCRSLLPTHQNILICYDCGKPNHMARNCRNRSVNLSIPSTLRN